MRPVVLQVASVLNAFRHHGEGDFEPCSEPSRLFRVLNAFRHHGEGDVVGMKDKQRLVTACSTPFGITARGTIDATSD